MPEHVRVNLESNLGFVAGVRFVLEKMRARGGGGLREDDDPLALAQRRVWGAQKIVAEQKRRIAGLRIARASTFDAVRVLSTFESNLRLFTEHRDAV
jgi:hypothetical protein